MLALDPNLANDRIEHVDPRLVKSKMDNELPNRK
jgi:hypothetical protein